MGGCGSLGVSEEMGLSDVVDKKGSAILFYLHSMVTIQIRFSPFFFVFPAMGSMLGAFYWLFLWDFKK